MSSIDRFLLVPVRYLIAVMWGVISEVGVDQLKVFVHGFRTHQFSLNFESITVLLGYSLFIIVLVIWVAYLMERFFREREQRIIFVASILVTGFFYPPL